jgi:hypothetical protein
MASRRWASQCDATGRAVRYLQFSTSLLAKTRRRRGVGYVRKPTFFGRSAFPCVVCMGRRICVFSCNLNLELRIGGADYTVVHYLTRFKGGKVR